jgi:hypothetical protein
MLAPPKSAIALRWGKKMAELDGYIFVTAEYNHGLPSCSRTHTRLCLCRIQSQAGYIRRLWKRGSRTSGGAVAPGSCGTASGHDEAHRSCQRRRSHRHAYARQDLCRFPLSRRVGRSCAGKSGVVGKCPQGRASTGNARDGRSSLIARYPRRFTH